MEKFRTYGKGFINGLGILLIALIIFNVIKHYLFGEPKGFFTYKSMSLLEISALVIVGYFVRKFKQPRAWMVPTVCLTFYILPFLLGAIEYEKKYNSHNQ